MENCMINPNSIVPAAKTGTVITPKVVTYVERYQTFARKTAESIIGLAETLIEAETTLDGVEFSIFCDQVGIKVGDATYSKLRAIGLNASRFNPYLDRLPNAWTTLYKLAKMTPDQFSLVAESLTPFTTAKELGFAVTGKAEKKEVDLSISLGSLSSEIKSSIYADINELKSRYGFKVKEGQTFIVEMKNLKQHQPQA